MTNKPTEMSRRALLQSAGGVALGQMAIGAAGAASASGSASAAPGPAGKPGDFDFLAGSWKINHRRLKASGGDDWDVFEGEATCWTVLNGVASIEELRIPARDFAGMGIRVLDIKARIWSDFWVNARSGVLTPPGMPGSFVDGVGTFMADDTDGDQPIKVRGVWDRITPTSCRWHQAVSRDGGASWQANWFMDWLRA